MNAPLKADVFRTPPLHVALPGQLSRAVNEAAAARGDHPQTMVSAVMAQVMERGLLDDILGVAPASARAPGQARQVFDNFPRGLTLDQAAVLYVLGFHGEADGVFRLPAVKIALIAGRIAEARVNGVLDALEKHRLIQFVPEKPRHMPFGRCWRLTAKGRAVFSEMVGN